MYLQFWVKFSLNLSVVFALLRVKMLFARFRRAGDGLQPHAEEDGDERGDDEQRDNDDDTGGEGGRGHAVGLRRDSG